MWCFCVCMCTCTREKIHLIENWKMCVVVVACCLILFTQLKWMMPSIFWITCTVKNVLRDMNVHFHWVEAWLSKQSQKCGWTNGRQAKAFVNKCFQTYCCMPHAFDFHFHKETQYFRINKTLTICYPKHEWNGHVFFAMLSVVGLTSH